MSRAKFPGLQEKFEDCIKKGFKGKSSVSMNEIIKTINPYIEEYKKEKEIDDVHIQDLKRNLSNYITRALDNEVIISLGRKRGYKLVEKSIVAAGDNICEEIQPTTDGKINISKESYLHFPATLLLSFHFKSTVFSFPNKTNNLKSGNPDMFMIRENVRFELDEELPLDILKKVDASPELILSSIELKYGLKDRNDILKALSQTAINGSWANENWLVYFEESESPKPLDEDCMDFAKSNGIGIIKISLTEDREYEVNPLLAAKQNSTLQLNSDFGSNKKVLLKNIIDEIKDYKGSYKDEDGDYAKLSVLLLRALNNCTKQRDIPENAAELIKNFEKYTIFNENKSCIYNTLPGLIQKGEIDHADMIKKQIGSFSLDDSENVISLIKKLESKEITTQNKDSKEKKKKK